MQIPNEKAPAGLPKYLFTLDDLAFIRTNPVGDFSE